MGLQAKTAHYSLLNIAPAVGAALNINFVLNYDALLEFDPATSMVTAHASKSLKNNLLNLFI